MKNRQHSVVRRYEIDLFYTSKRYLTSCSNMMATDGAKSSTPTLGIIRRRGARSGSVTRYKIIVRILVGLGENQDRIALKNIARVSTSHRSLRKLTRNVNAARPPAS